VPSLATLAKKLTASDIEQILLLKRAAPLEAKRQKIIGELAKLDKQIAALEGGKAPKVPGKRGRKPGRKRGRPAKATSIRGRPARGRPGRKRGRPAKAAGAPIKRGPGRPPKAKPAAKVGRPRKRPALTGPAREAMLARMAKARAAMAAKRAAAAQG